MQSQTFIRTKGKKFRAFNFFALSNCYFTKLVSGTISNNSNVSLIDAYLFSNQVRSEKQHQNKENAQQELDKWRKRVAKQGFLNEVIFQC